MTIGVLVALGPAAFEPGVVAGLPADHVHVVRRCVDVADLLATAASRQALVAVVSASLGGLDLRVVHRLAAEGVAVVGVTASADSADEAVLRRFGVERVVAADDLASLVEAVLEAATGAPDEPESAGGGAVLEGQPGTDQPGTVIAVWGPTGAPGRSTLALGLGAEFAAQGLSTTVIDADVYGGSLAQTLGLLDEASGLLAAAREANVGELSPRRLAAHCREVAPRLRLLTGLPRADRWIEAGAGLMRHVVDQAARLGTVTVIDCGFSLELDEELSYDTTAPRRNGATVEIVSRADTVIAVGSADPVGLSRLIRGVHDLQVLAPGQTPVVVLNRLRPQLWPAEDVEQLLRRAVTVNEIGWLPFDPTACDRAVASATTLREAAPASKLARAVRELASDLSGQPLPLSRSRWARWVRS